MMRRFVKSFCASRLGSRARQIRAVAVAAFTAGAAVAALQGEAQAQEIQLTGPLAGAPAVRKLRLHRAKRFQVELGSSFTLLDQYERTILPGGALTYHFTDWLGIGIWGGYGFQYQTGLSEQIQTKAIDYYNCDARPDTRSCKLTAVNLTRGKLDTDQLGKISWAVAPQLQVVPFRGKIALFSSLFVDTDVNIFAGAAFIGLQERKACGQDDAGKSITECANPATFQTEGRVAIAPTFGLGLNFYPASFVGIGFEFRAMPFAWNTSGFDNHGGGNNKEFPDTFVNAADREFHINPMASVRLAFQFPVAVKTTD